MYQGGEKKNYKKMIYNRGKGAKHLENIGEGSDV